MSGVTDQMKDCSRKVDKSRKPTSIRHHAQRIDDMTAQHDTAKRRWPRFSMRTLIVLITVVCAYMACWRITATAGVADVIDDVYGYDNAQIDGIDFNPWTPMPMIVRLDEYYAIGIGSIMSVRRYYFWYFVGSVPLPFQNQDYPVPEVG